jgi:streptomycin 6-kinase
VVSHTDVVAFVVPPLLARTVEVEGPLDRRAWLARLADTVDELAARWGLTLGAPFEPGGQTAWVAPVRDRAGRELVLKVGWAHHEAEQEPDGLQAWRGQGAVMIYDWCRLGQSVGLLLELCEPGTPLKRISPEAEQDRIIAGLLGRLWHAPTVGFSFRPLLVMCQAWVTGFHLRLAALPPGAGVIDPGLARAGTELFLALAASSDRDVLLCTDLHAGNVLAAQREPWLVIDPKPFVGDPCYDVLQHLLNCQERLAEDPAGLAQRMADLLDLDGERVRQWLFARCVIEGADDPTMQAVAAELAPI